MRMSRPHLLQFNGAAVQMRIDGAQALGILFFSPEGEVHVTSLCFVESGAKCPLLRHMLTEEEICGLMPMSHNQLASTLEISTQASAVKTSEPVASENPVNVKSEVEKLAAIRAESADLLERARCANEKSRELMAEFERLRVEAAENLRGFKAGRQAGAAQQKLLHEPAPLKKAGRSSRKRKESED